ncbi:GTP-binding protein Era [Helicobacter sp. NHP19-012]|uniref:GTPase Era n=1 Tax=Helicobacter gastrofelis TaxID=2849642 RepID=A0ABN6I940_9HELI|nr:MULTISPECIES: GTPase Era [unclassified Helicobacter]BCZ19913.1 GTP-binding protein Era [Helicobacter sp. NHP19-012]GMB95582.1 GTP-binding protein Era [Helicobacter sp. NHP22-001]
MTKAGFIALIGQPNAGKSTLINALLGARLALTSHKANATRKILKAIIPYTDKTGAECQMVFLDTPGLCTQEKLLNRAMVAQSHSAFEACDLAVFVAGIHDSLKAYEEFLKWRSASKPHLLALNKIDTATNAQVLAKLKDYTPYSQHFKALIPISAQKGRNLNALLDEVVKLLPNAPFYYDPDMLGDIQMREIYAEIIREQIFKFLSDEIPYESAVLVKAVQEQEHIEKIQAQIIVAKESQQKMVIGKGGAVVKKIGQEARRNIEGFIQKKVFLRLEVVVQKNWTSMQDQLKKMGYVVE